MAKYTNVTDCVLSLSGPDGLYIEAAPGQTVEVPEVALDAVDTHPQYWQPAKAAKSTTPDAAPAA